MKFFIYSLTLTVTIILSVTELMGNASNISNLEISPNSTVANQRTPLNLFVPDLVTVRLNQESYTGKLTAFNANSLMIEANGRPEKILISQIKEIEFKGDVWVKNTDGTIRKFPWRGGNKIFPELPINALKLDKDTNTATLNLDSLSERGYNRFVEDTIGKNYGIKMITFDSSQKITVKIKQIIK